MAACASPDRLPGWCLPSRPTTGTAICSGAGDPGRARPDPLVQFVPDKARGLSAPSATKPQDHPPRAAPGEGNVAVHPCADTVRVQHPLRLEGLGCGGVVTRLFPGQTYRWCHLQNSCSLHPARVSYFLAPFPKLVGRRRPWKGHPSSCPALWGGFREQGLSGVWRGGPQPELFGRCRWAGPCLSPRGLGTGGSRGLGAFPRRRWLTLAPQDVSVLPVLHPLLGQGSQTRVPPRPILYRVPTRGRKPVPDEYSMHGVNKQMHEGDVHEAGTRTPEALAPRTPDSGAGSWERPVADSSEGRSLSIGLAGSPPHLLTARPVTPS